MDEMRTYQSDPEYKAIVEAILRLEDLEPYLTGQLLEDAQILRRDLTTRLGTVARRLQRKVEGER